jgi:SAM-dependent methyltransferase
VKYIERNESVVTGQKNLESLHLMKDYPVFFGCVDHPASEDLRADLSWAICPRSGVIQLDRLLPPEIVYQAQHVEGVGPTWARYYQAFAQYLVPKLGKNVLEIGGGSGQLAEVAVSLRPDLHWTLLEQNPTHPGSDRISIIKRYFDESFKAPGKVDTVVISQVLEHAYDPTSFLKTIHRTLPEGGSLLMAYPDLKLWLERKYTNAINFEHSMFLTDYFVDYLLRREGFEIRDKRPYPEHSFFYDCVKTSRPQAEPAFENKYEEYKKIYLDYKNYYESLVQSLNKQVSQFKGKTYVFGAHIFAQSMFQFGLDETKIAGLIDNAKSKQGRRLYGTNSIVVSPEVLRTQEPVAVVLKVGVHRDDILKQLLSINSDVVIFE